MKHHPYAELFPMMPDADLQAMADDIIENGLAEPITTYKKMILDGRNRRRACEIADIQPQFVAFEGNDEEALAFILSKNLNRRHLTESQRAMVAGSLANMTVGQPKKNRANLPDNSTTNAEAAEKLGVSERSVKTAKKVLEEGTPDLVKAVEAGEVSVSAAVEVVDLPKPDQKKLVKAGPAAVKAKASELRQSKKQPEPVSKPIPVPAATEPTTTNEPSDTRKPYKVPTVDEDGIPIQEWAVEAFAAVPEFRDLIRIVKELGKRFSALADEPGGHFLYRRGQWKTLGKNTDGSERGIWRFDALENILMLLEDTMPLHTDCPYAHKPDSPHDDEKCATCRGLRWTPKQQRSNTPKEIVAALFTNYCIEGAI